MKENLKENQEKNKNGKEEKDLYGLTREESLLDNNFAGTENEYLKE